MLPLPLPGRLCSGLPPRDHVLSPRSLRTRIIAGAIALAAAAPAAAGAATPNYPGISGGADVPASTQIATGIGSTFDVTDSTNVGWSSVSATVTTNRGTLTANAGGSGATVSVASNTITISGSMSSVENVLNSQGTAFARLTQATPGSATVTVSVSPSPSFTIGGVATYFSTATGHYYRLNLTRRNWTDVNSDAQGTSVASAPGYVSVVRTQEEHDFLAASVLPAAGTGDPNQVWLGAEVNIGVPYPAPCPGVGPFRWAPGANAPAGDTTAVVPACFAAQSGWTPWAPNQPSLNSEFRLAYFDFNNAEGWRWHDSNASTAYSLQEFGSNTTYTAASRAATITASDPPYNTVRPTISGTVAVGQPLTASTGTWLGSPAPAFSYQWQQCTSQVGATTTFASLAGTFPEYVRLDPSGNVFSGNRDTNNISKLIAANTPVNTLGQAVASPFTWAAAGSGPFGMAIDANGNVYTANRNTNTITKASIQGATTTLTSAASPFNVAVDSNGNVYAANLNGNSVSKFLPGATTPTQTFTAANGVSFNEPYGMAFDSSDNLYLVDRGNNRVVKITPGGATSAFATIGTSGDRLGIAVDAEGNVYVPSGTTPGQVRKFLPDGTQAGGNWPVAITHPQDAAIGPDGNLYVSRGPGGAPGSVLRITPAGIATDIGATGNWPLGIAFDAAGNIYVANRDSSTITRVTTMTCSDIAGATAATYTLQPSDAGRQLRVRVTGDNGVSSSAFSAITTGPRNTGVPAITGTTAVGQTLTTSKGSWSATPAIPDPSGYSYRWQRCESTAVAGDLWVSRTTNANGWYGMEWGGPPGARTFVAVAESGDGDRVMTSPDGENWTTRSTPGGTANNWTSVVWGDPPGAAAARFVAVASGGSGNRVMTSADGATWESPTQPAFVTGGIWRAVTWGGPAGQELFVAVAYSGAVMTSPDGVTWTQRTSAAGNQWFGITWGDPPGATQGQFVAVADSGAGNRVMTSPDGITWTARSTNDNNWNDVTFGGPLGEEKFVAVAWGGDGNRVMTSPDGITWTTRSTPVDSAFTAVAWGGFPGQERFVAVADSAPGGTPNRRVITSPDGVAWAAQDAASSNRWHGVEWGGPAGRERFAAVAYDGGSTNRAMTSTGSDCADISGATSQTYTLQAADYQKHVRSQVTADNGVDPDGVAYSAISSQIAGQAPTNAGGADLPAITGTAAVGSTLTAGNGTWTATPAVTGYTYQWQRCNSSGASCTSISGATNQTYAVASADAGSTLRVQVTAANGVSPNGVATSEPTTAVPQAPTITTAPSISGTARVGQTLTTTNGVWSAAPAIPDPSGYTYQWQRCDAGGTNCADIGGATSSTYTLQGDDYSRFVRSRVTADNGVSPNGVAVSLVTSQVAGIAPTNAGGANLPTITGTAAVGSTLTATNGTWSGTPATFTYTYEWQRCDAAGANCTSISGATNQTYVPTTADSSGTIRVSVTAANGVSPNGVATSTQTAVVTGPPRNASPPIVTGTGQVGQTLTATSGTWTATPAVTGYAYQWRRCDSSGANCADISGATTATYALVAADASATIRVSVTATNTVGSTAADSSATTQIAPLPPSAPSSSGAVPPIGGTAAVGSTLTADPGTWNGNPAPTFTYRWQRCDADGTNCVDIAGATSSTYTPTAADTGMRLQAVITATNTVGSAVVDSPQTAAVGGPPTNRALPTITGTPQQGETLTADPGAWTASPSPTFAYQWRRCDSAGANCIDVGSNQTTYTLTADDNGKTIRVAVTAANGVSPDATATSEPTTPVVPLQAPVNNGGVPPITGAATVGSTLTAAPGTWTGTPTPTISYQWQRCDADGTNCSPIPGATGQTYVPTADDTGRRIQVAVTGTNSAGSSGTASTAVAESAPTAVISGPPVNRALPAITGTFQERSTLSADPGAWTASPSPTFTYQWQRCNAAGSSCSPISGATETTYTLTSADNSGTIRVQVTAANGISPDGIATSAETAQIAPEPQTAPTNAGGADAPAITGTAQVGEVLTAAVGTWSANPAVANPAGYSRQWQRCDADGGNCLPIAGATAATYTPTGDDDGATLRVTVTATNSVGAGSATSAPTAAVLPEPPRAPTNAGGADAPSISGTAQVGITLTATSGTWSALPPVSGYAYQWQRCESPTAAGITWRTRSAPSSFGWRSVVWGGGTFVAVGGDAGQPTSDDVLTSADGVHWSAAEPAQNNSWQSVTWGNGTFVAVSSDGPNRVMTSTDGITWTAQTAAAARQWKSITWGGPAGQKTFVAVAENGGIMTSADGANWTSQTDPEVRDWRSVTWGDPPGATPGQFVAVAYSGSAVGQVMTSPDGVIWTARTASIARGWYGVTWGGTSGEEKFVAVSRTGDGDQIMTSDNGENWTTHTSPAGNRFWNSVAWGGPPGEGLFVAVSDTGAPNQVMTSPDGITWTLRSSSSGEKWRAVAWGGPAGQQLFVSVAYDQPQVGGGGAGADRVMTSSSQGCVDIPDAYASSYIAQPADYGLYLRVRVTASNGVAPDGVATSASTAAVAGSAPVRLSDPELFGLARVGRTITATPGVWTATPQVPHPGGYAYQWQRCVAGNGAASSFATATLNMPISIAVGADGKVFAGNGQGLDTLSRFLADGDDESPVQLAGSPRGIAVDRSGNVYVADEFGRTVWKILPDGTPAGGNWPAALPNAALPSDLAIDAYGNVYTANSGLDSVSKISPDGTVVGGPWPAATGDRPVAIAIDSVGNLYTANRDSSTITRIDSTTAASSGSPDNGYKWAEPAHPPVDLAIAPNGDVYTVTGAASKMVSKFVYPDGSPAGGNWPVSLGMETGDPAAIVVGQDGSVYTANEGTNRFYKLSPSGVVAGGSWPVEGGSVGSGPRGLALDASGNLYSAAITSNRIIRIASGYSCTDISGATASTYVTQPADEGAYVRVKAIVDNGVSPDGIAYSLPLGPIAPAAAETLVVNKYSPNRSSTPGCEDPDFTAIGSVDDPTLGAFGAVGVAASGDTIVICGSPDAATDPYLPNVTLGAKSLTFVGDGPDLTILDGQNARTHIYANLAPDRTDGYLRLEAMTITRGLDINSGGAIQTFCRDIDVDDVRFSGNRAVGFGEGGGAIHASRDGTCATLGDVSVANSTFAGNVAEHLIGYGEGGADGGAILAYGGVTVTDSVFEDNEAKATANSTDPSLGGAIWAKSGLSVTNSTFHDNSASGPGSIGGAILAEGGPATSTITGSTFTDNAATGSGSFAGAVRRQAGDLTVTNSTFTGNSAVAAPAASGDSVLTLVSVTSSGNSGPYVWDAGGDLRIGNSIIDEAGEACRAPLPPSAQKVNLGGNVIADTTASTGDCLPFVGTGGGPAERVASSAIALQSPDDNGGPTETMALGLDSVARASAAANLLGADPTDQRGLARPETGQSSGAYQLTTRQLVVTKAGTGSGTVTSSPAGLDCGPACSGQTAEVVQRPPFTTVTLTAVAASGSTFAGWGGACTGTGSCVAAMSEARSVTATFTAAAPSPDPNPNPNPDPEPQARTVVTAARALADRRVTLDVRVNQPGDIRVEGSYPAGSTRARVRACTARRTVARAGTFRLSCPLNARTRALLATRSLRIDLRVTFTTPDGKSATTTRTVLAKRFTPYVPPITG
jgi:hypothetical protein